MNTKGEKPILRYEKKAKITLYFKQQIHKAKILGKPSTTSRARRHPRSMMMEQGLLTLLL